jgi:hypothetical protein
MVSKTFDGSKLKYLDKGNRSSKVKVGEHIIHHDFKYQMDKKEERIMKE